jgi:hypothetical protein
MLMHRLPNNVTRAHSNKGTKLVVKQINIDQPLIVFWAQTIKRLFGRAVRVS